MLFLKHKHLCQGMGLKMKIRLIVPYFLLFAFSVMVFLVLLFPHQQVARHISQTLTDPDRDIYTVMETIKPAFPFYLKSEDTSISIGPTIKIKPDFIKIKPGSGLIFGDHKNIGFSSKLYNGLVEGSIGFDNKRPIAYTNANLNISDIEFNKIQYNTRLAGVTMTGKIDGEYRYVMDKENRADPGQGSFSVSDLSIVLKNSLFNRLKLSQINFSKIDAKFSQDKQNINLIQLTATGSAINVKLNGIIRIENPISQSRLTLTGQILPDSPYLANFINSAFIKTLVKNIKKDGIRFTIKGTLKQPVIKI